MSEQPGQIARLVYKQLTRQLSNAEEQQLQRWIAASDENRALYTELTDEQRLGQDVEDYRSFESEKAAAWKKMGVVIEAPRRNVVSLFSWKKSAAAASVLVLLGAGIYMIQKRSFVSPAVAVVTSAVQDAAPGHAGAVLKLSDGREIVLDSAANGELASDGASKVQLHDNQISYAPMGSGAEVYNELSTPRGRKFQLALPDGSQVWLNAASSIRYPTKFVGKERRVQVTGEAFFQIAQNKEQPFIVHINGLGADKRSADIQVLGTSFNVMAYGDEATVTTTLIEGAVKVVSKGTMAVLAPGQQAQVSENSTVKLVKGADIAQATAWKDGLFSFKDADVPTIMRQIARWYDVDVQYAGKVPTVTTTGEAPRDINLTSLLKIIELSGVHMDIEGKKIIVR